MPTLAPVEHDPFAAPPGGALKITVRPSDKPQPKLVPVEHDPFAAAPGYIEDMAKSLPTGVVKGVTALAGLPGDVRNAVHSGVDYLFTQFATELGASPEQIEEAKRELAASLSLPMKATAHWPRTADIRSGVESVTGPLYKPQTTPGRYAETFGEFIPGAGRKLVTMALAPALASEAAGQATEGSALEPIARAGAAITTGLTGAALTRPRTAEQAIRRALPDNINENTIRQAEALTQDASARGIRLTWAEALEQVAPGTGLTNMQRTLEGARDSRGTMGEFFAQRPAQMESAARAEFDNIAPAIVEPAAIGPAIGQAATETIDTVRGSINRATRPLYRAATSQRISPQDFARVSRDPVFQEGLRRVRSDPFIGPQLANHPDDSVAVIDAIKKQLDETGRNLRDPLSGTARNNYAASIVDQGSDRMVRAADVATGSIPASMGPLAGNPGFQGIQGTYEAARAIQEEARRRFLQPLLNGPLGRLARTDQDTKDAIGAPFPVNPLPGSEREIFAAVRALSERVVALQAL